MADVSPEVEEVCQDLILTNCQLRRFKEKLHADILKGLSKKTHPNAVVKCYITYVQDLPSGNEKGHFLGLDLGGTRFRVLLVHLLGGSEYKMEVKAYTIPHDVIVSDADTLFDFIAECMDEFVKEMGIADQALPLGFTFSFPLTQLGLTKGILVRWTKGFDCSGAVGNDVVQLLQKALIKKNTKVAVTAVLNDTTGTLMSCALSNNDCKIGLIVGTGSNACYLEKRENAEMMDEPDHGSGKVIINTEFGAFGEDGSLDFIRTKYDKMLDENSINPGKQIHEKLVSGMYLGELVRLICYDLCQKGLLFAGNTSEKLEVKDSIGSEVLSEVESDPEGVYNKAKEFLIGYGIGNPSDKDLANFRYVCECITRRSACCVSAAMATLVEKVDDPFSAIGVDGALFRLHPHYPKIMKHKIRQLLHPKYDFELITAEDGSGRGAAIVASVAARQVLGENF